MLVRHCESGTLRSTSCRLLSWFERRKKSSQANVFQMLSNHLRNIYILYISWRRNCTGKSNRSLTFFHPDLSLGWNPPPNGVQHLRQRRVGDIRACHHSAARWMIWAESCRAGTWQWPFYIFWEVPELVAFSLCSGQVARKLRSAQHGGADLRDWDPITSGSVTDSKGPKIEVHRGTLNHPNLDHSEF
jgi:hypothetical protein